MSASARLIDLLRGDPGWLVAGLVALIYSRALDAFFAPVAGLSIGQALSLAVLGVLGARVVLGFPTGEWRPATAVFASYCALGLASLAYAMDRPVAQDELLDVVQNGVVFFAIILGVGTRDALRRFIWGLVSGGALIAAVNLYQLATGTFDDTYWDLAVTQVHSIVGGEADHRIGGPSLGPNGLAHALVVCIPLAYERWRNAPTAFGRAAAAIAGVLLVVATVFTFSRNGFLTLAVVAALIVAYHRIPIRRALAAGLVAGVLLVGFAPDLYVDRVSTLVDVGSGGTRDPESMATGRISEYLAAGRMFTENPVLGVGMGNFPSHYLEHSTALGLDQRREDRAPHSLYLQFAAELGMVGAAWLAGVIAMSVVGLRRARALATSHRDREGAELLAAVEIAFIAFLCFSLFRHVALVRYFLIPIALALVAPSAALAHRAGRPAAALTPRVERALR